MANKKACKKLFIIRKYIMATSAHEALKKERRHRPDDVYVDADWRTNNQGQLESAIGFTAELEYDDD